LEQYGYGRWDLVAINIVMFSAFLMLLPFRRRIEKRSTGIYLAFITSVFAEMYGFPLTIYFLTWYIGYQNPLTHESGHLLYPVIAMSGFGTIGHAVTDIMVGIGVLLVIVGWREIHESGDRVFSKGLYSCVRHPQYLGILLITLGLLIQWITIPTLLMWPILGFAYYRLAKQEEREMERRFGGEYAAYRRRVPMFIPFSFRRRLNPSRSYLSFPDAFSDATLDCGM